jgi:leader peptidase (prepilin peptidase)/N-methyltransferase
VSPLFLYEAVAFVLGLLFGSFLNVCISRLPRRESIAHPRSHCPQCGAMIRWYDNVPLLSFLLLRARCLECKAPIPWRYPLVELVTGLWFASIAIRFSSSRTEITTKEGHAALILVALELIILGFLLIGLMVMDWETLTLPDAFTFSGIAIGMVLVFIRAAFLGPTENQITLSSHHIQLTSPGNVTDHGNVFMTGPEALIMGRIVAICGAALIPLLIRWVYKALRHRDGMGLGDVKLLAMIAAFLGFWPAVLAFFLGAFLATVYAVVLLLRGKAQASTKLAFGSFLAIGGLISAQYGNVLINMYAVLLR